ncbi:MAG: hypothetical protein ACSLE2_15220 [Lysobacterales bacterium]
MCVISLAICLALTACTTPQMRVDPALESAATAYPVQGRSSWLLNQQLRFGEFSAGPVSRGWTKGYDYPFIIRFTGAREKLRFPVDDGMGNEVMVHCIGKLHEQDLRFFREFFDVNIKTTDTFACTLEVNDSAAYDFYASNLNVQQNLGYMPMQGSVKGGTELVELRSVWHLLSGQRALGTEPLGVEFLQGGEVIGAVETVNEGRVWVRDDLDQESRLVIGAVAAALLLRSGLAEHNEPE